MDNYARERERGREGERWREREREGERGRESERDRERYLPFVIIPMSKAAITVGMYSSAGTLP